MKNVQEIVNAIYLLNGRLEKIEKALPTHSSAIKSVLLDLEKIKEKVNDVNRPIVEHTDMGEVDSDGLLDGEEYVDTNE